MLFRQGLLLQQKSQSGLYAWGNNAQGQLGNNTTTSTSSPVLVSSITSVRWTKIAPGSHTLALRNDGSLWSWGFNSRGQLGQGTQTSYSATPLNVTGTTIWSKVSAGSGFIVAIQSNGTLWAWGDNFSGQLGTASLTSTSSPVLVSGPAGASWATVSAGAAHALGITTTGQLYAWGANTQGQLGNNSTTNVSSPVNIGTFASWALVALNGQNSLAITTTGQLYAWGLNSSGQLGDNTNTGKSSPILVSGPTNTSWSAVGGGRDHSLGITITGQLYAWGSNTFGQLGDITVVSKSSPILVSGPATTSWSSISGGTGHSLGITTTGQLYAWGQNGFGQLGDITIVNKSSPILVSGPATTSWSAVTCGLSHSLAFTQTGQLYAWGFGTSGQVGIGSIVSVSSPVLVSGPAATSWIAITGNTNTPFALTASNILWGWGVNSSEVLGVAFGLSSPSQVGTSSWVAVSVKGLFSVAITTEGRLYSWGANTSGTLGELSTIDKSSPVLVSGPTNASWSAVSLGNGFALAITSTGELYGWGSNTNGAVGNNSLINVSSPVLVSGPATTSWSVVACGENHALAISTIGKLYAWGLNSAGQLGILSTTRKSSPVLVSGPATTSWLIMSGGEVHSAGITSTGQLYAWGSGSLGKLGDLTIAGKSSPILVSGPTTTSWLVVSCGFSYSLALTITGQLYAWGRNNSGQLGDGTLVNTSSPVIIPSPTSFSWTVIAAGNDNSAGITSES
jgi:alpha-tubulin suppressor-like RCC1 family protein